MTLRRDLARTTAALLAGVAVFSAVPAFAGFSDATTTASMGVTSGVLAAPTAPTAVASCVGTVVKSPRVTVSWTATSSTYATGYAILRLTAGSYVQIGTVSGRTTTSYADNTVLLATTYTYKVRATYQNWFAQTTGSASATTAVVCL